MKRFVFITTSVILVFVNCLYLPISAYATGHGGTASFGDEEDVDTSNLVPLEDAWEYVEPLYDYYNTTAIATDSGITITTEEEYLNSVYKTLLANDLAISEDIHDSGFSWDAYLDLMDSSTELRAFIGANILVNPYTGAYYVFDSAGKQLNQKFRWLLEEWGLVENDDGGYGYPTGTTEIRRGTYWYQLPNTRFGVNYILKSGGPIWACNVNGQTMMLALVNSRWSSTSSDYGYSISMSSSYNGTSYGWMTYPSNFGGEYAAISNSEAISDFFGGEEYSSSEISDSIIYPVDPDVSNSIATYSPVTTYNDWETISNNNYTEYGDTFVTNYNSNEQIYNSNYYYNITNYTSDMPLWVVNGNDYPIYSFDVTDVYTIEDVTIATDENLDVDSSFIQTVYEGLPPEVVALVVTGLGLTVAFAVFKS